MTVYIFGGSNTAMLGGWADLVSVRLNRRMSVRNLGLGATNSLNALTRLLSDVELVAGDTVVWANAINDAICLCGHTYEQDRLIEYVETMVIHCQTHGVRFLPLLFDTFSQHLVHQQPAYLQKLHDLAAHYSIDVVNIPACVERDTGTTFIPRQHFTDVLHMLPGGELCEFVADETAAAVLAGGAPPAQVQRLFLDPGTTFERISEFEPTGHRAPFQTEIFAAQAWNPRITHTCHVPKGTQAEVEGVTLVADPHHGRFVMQVGARELMLSAVHNFPMTGRPIALSISLRVIEPAGMPVKDGDVVTFDWSETQHPISSDMYFRPVPAGPFREPSAARVISMLLRHSPATGDPRQGA